MESAEERIVGAGGDTVGTTSIQLLGELYS